MLGLDRGPDTARVFDRSLLDENRVPELVRSITACFELCLHLVERGVVDKRAKQLEVARAALVRARKYRIHYAQPTARADPLGGQPFARRNGSVERSRVLKRSDDCCANCYDAPRMLPRLPYSPRGRPRYTIWLVQRQSCIERRVARGRDSRRVGKRREPDALSCQRSKHPPIDSESRRWRLERNWWSGNCRPHIPQREWPRDVGILDRLSMAGESLPDFGRRAVEAK